MFPFDCQAVTDGVVLRGLTWGFFFRSLLRFMKTRESGLSKPTGKKKTGKRAANAPLTPPASPGQSADGWRVQSAECKVGATPPASLAQPARQTAPAAPAPQPAQREAAAPAAPQRVNVVFSTFQPQARQVSVCGEFNGWSPEANPMEAHGEGRWQTVLALEAGRYQYKFVIDGEWMPDPEAKQNVCNPFGTLNSVVEAG